MDPISWKGKSEAIRIRNLYGENRETKPEKLPENEKTSAASDSRS